MILSSDVKRVMICAPSNGAVDEIVSRIATRGFIGDADPLSTSAGQSFLRSSRFDLENVIDGILLRIGAFDSDPAPEVKKHTLDVRMTDLLNGKKAGELRNKHDGVTELLKELEKDSSEG
jgi:hypothetical protein